MTARPFQFSESLTFRALVALGALLLAGAIAYAAPLPHTDTESARYRQYVLDRGGDPDTLLLLEVPASEVVPLAVSEPEDAPQAVVAPQEAAPVDDACTLNPAFVAASDEQLEGCTGPRSRFCKIKPGLKPLYERVCRETGVPVALMYAVGEYETHNRPTAMADGGRSCGLFGFNTWKSWGFASLAECHDPEASIRKLAESYTKNRDRMDTRTWLCRHNAGPRACSVGVAATYADRVLQYADALYAP